MRESNFAFPAQNKACVCITSQLYDRRALDTTSSLPLFNSLTHLTYLTSTSPRIREIMTMDGGLERLVRILHEFCICPSPPENPAVLYGLMPPNARPPKLAPMLNPPTFDKHAAFRFSLAFQCIVNIGVRGSEPIRSRVVQAGTLDVVGCILEAWLANKGFAVGPSAGANSVHRDFKEQRYQRKLEQRQREDALHLQRALQRQLQTGQQVRLRQYVRDRINEDDESMDYSPAETSTSQILLLSDSTSQPSNSASNSDTDISTDNSLAATPQESGTPTGSVVIPSRDRSGTIIARPIWDHPQPTTRNTATAGPTIMVLPPRGRRMRHRDLPPESPTTSDASRPETEAEDDGDGDIDMDMREGSRRIIDSGLAPTSTPERRFRGPAITRQHMARRAVGIVSDEPATVPQTLQVGGLGLDRDAHIIINEGGDIPVGVGDGVVEVGVGVGVEDGIVSLEQNDDFAMGAPPGAPGAIGEAPTPRILNINAATDVSTNERRRRNTTTIEAPDVTPRAAAVSLPTMMATGTVRQAGGHQRNATIRARPATAVDGVINGATPADATNPATATAPAMNITPTNTLGGGRTMSGSHGSHHHRDTDSGPYRDEDVLLSLQLLAYLSKYPHVRQAFYKPRVTFHPASVNLGGARFGMGVGPSMAIGKQKEKERAVPSSSAASMKDSFLRAFSSVTPASSGNSSRGKEKERQSTPASATGSLLTVETPVVFTPTAGSNAGAPSSARQTNVFSLVERFTYKPSSSDNGDGMNAPPKLPPEIQYWAGVIMRNACRKDENRGGIRQCANMMCGKWETYPREFAKCRRCRKAKYCGKECQSTAWSEGHRFWCSAKDVEEETSNTYPNASSNGDQNDHHNAEEGTSTLRATSSTRSSAQVSDDGSEQAGASVTARSSSNSRTERRQHRERYHHHFNSGVIHPSSTNYVSPTTLSGVRAEPSMTRDRTIVQSTQTQQPGSSSPSHVRLRLMATIRPPAVQESLHDPTSTGYIPFNIQVNIQGNSGDREAGRRGAETISGVGGAALPSPSSNRLASGEDGFVIPSSPVRAGTGQQLQMSYTQTITQANANLHPHGQVRIMEDWTMTSPMTPPAPLPRRLRMGERVSRSRSEDREDDMILG